ncbi:hypothetical protein P879_05103 [Paragonimus westermani]|uniref:Uncharacterized protein n=1 Tax=Paragonimus westermani TaxID=34504 RepID=A0A8T0DLZ4_9TREM|nr:hypothetical protein P879_05103 [Paragonimus westermani]
MILQYKCTLLFADQLKPSWRNSPKQEEVLSKTLVRDGSIRMPPATTEASRKPWLVKNKFKPLKNTLRANVVHPTDWLLSKKMVLHPRYVCKERTLPKPDLYSYKSESETQPPMLAEPSSTHAESMSDEVNDLPEKRRPMSSKTPLVDLRQVTSLQPMIQKSQSARSAQSASPKGCRQVIKHTNGKLAYSSPSCFLEGSESARQEPILRRPSSAPIKICSEPTKQSETQLSADIESHGGASPCHSCLPMDEKNEFGRGRTSLSGSRKPLDKNVIQLEAEYNQALKNHGWKMEVPGDPLNLKKPYLPKRLSYTVAFEPGQTLPLPPRMKYPNKGTFFQPTFPAQPLSFTLSPEFPSEIYVAKMNAFRKTNGHWPYGKRQYAFAY